jgi:hypothetical protein
MDLALPFAGYKQSGRGRENRRAGVEACTETKYGVAAGLARRFPLPGKRIGLRAAAVLAHTDVPMARGILQQGSGGPRASIAACFDLATESKC